MPKLTSIESMTRAGVRVENAMEELRQHFNYWNESTHQTKNLKDLLGKASLILGSVYPAYLQTRNLYRRSIDNTTISTNEVTSYWDEIYCKANKLNQKFKDYAKNECAKGENFLPNSYMTLKVRK